jgi:beta-glucosidase
MLPMTRSHAIIPVILLATACFGCHQQLPESSPVTDSTGAPVLTVNGFRFRDLDKNGKLDPYEDIREPLDRRVDDLLGRMTLEEKAGMMFINGARVNADGTLGVEPAALGLPAMGQQVAELLVQQHMNHFNLWAIPKVRMLAVWYDRLQKLAECTRLGIPVTIASDPRSAFTNNAAFSASAAEFSQWCEPIGLAAIGDSAFTRQFADMVRREYLAVGIRVALHPQADLATEPRWPRIPGTFGEDAGLVSRMVKAYILGFQGTRLGVSGVACMVKHFPGGGPQQEGLDPHFDFTKGQVYPGHNFNYHLIPFKAAIETGVAEVMPYYGIPENQTSENVGMSFNKDIVTGILRDSLHFQGVVCTDWGILSDTRMGKLVWKARARGMENRSPEQRMLKAIEAGVDQFGGENIPGMLVRLVREGKVKESRLDSSVKRLLRVKFELGLFDNPYVDTAAVMDVVGNNAFRKAGEYSQRRSMVLLKNCLWRKTKILPLSGHRLRIYVSHIDPSIAARYADVVTDPRKADVAILRLSTPFYPIGDLPMARSFHHGDLDFKGGALDSVLQVAHKVPTIVDIYMDRPAVIPEINEACRGLLVDFGASDEAVMDVIFGKSVPGGRMPFEIPSSMQAVRAQKEDMPYDSKNPLYPFGAGLSY